MTIMQEWLGLQSSVPEELDQGEPLIDLQIALQEAAEGLDLVDPDRVVSELRLGPPEFASRRELWNWAVRRTADLVLEEPQYSQLAARLLARLIDEEVNSLGIFCFSDSITAAFQLGLISSEVSSFVDRHARLLNDAAANGARTRLDYLGMRTLYDRYLLRHPTSRLVVETPEYFFLRVACGLSQNLAEVFEFSALMSNLEYLPSSPTLFNSATTHPQLSSCYLLDSPSDELDSIYATYGEIARLSKHAGGIGVAFHRIRSRGSLIKGTNGISNGIVPWLKTLDCSVAAVNQGGRRKGAACVYLETWHADIEEFLELRDSTGDENCRLRHINIANWVPDLFMKRVEQDGLWSLFDPKKVPHLADLYGSAFEEAYIEAERAGLWERQLPARQLYARMMRTLAETGNGWMTFKDRANLLCNQLGTEEPGGAIVHLSNLCTEIIEVTSSSECGVCNLGSLNLARFCGPGGFDFDKLAQAARTAVTMLDRVVDINFYPTEKAARSNAAWRPVGLGVMGLADVFYQLRLPFDSPEAQRLSRLIAEEIYFNALWRSSELAERFGPHPRFSDTKTARGLLQFDLWGIQPSNPKRWDELRSRIRKFGLRNSLLVAIAPTATISAIAGCHESIEPCVSNLFKKETLSGEFIVVNKYLVRELKQQGLWNKRTIDALKTSGGSVQLLEGISSEIKAIFRTAWEIPMKSLIDMAAERGPFVDQSQSLSLFVESPTTERLASMYFYAWKAGLKTTYYLRSRPATRIMPATCAIDGPGNCEACQ